MKTIYIVCQEYNDGGWMEGTQLFTSAEEAVKHLRDYAAQRIMRLRRQGYTVDLLRCWRDSVTIVEDERMFEGKVQTIPTEGVTFRTYKDGEGYGYYDFRVFARYLWDSNEQYRNGRWPWRL